METLTTPRLNMMAFGGVLLCVSGCSSVPTPTPLPPEIAPRTAKLKPALTLPGTWRMGVAASENEGCSRQFSNRRVEGALSLEVNAVSAASLTFTGETHEAAGGSDPSGQHVVVTHNARRRSVCRWQGTGTVSEGELVLTLSPEHAPEETDALCFATGPHLTSDVAHVLHLKCALATAPARTWVSTQGQYEDADIEVLKCTSDSALPPVLQMALRDPHILFTTRPTALMRSTGELWVGSPGSR